ncbi:DUF4440 domain-containing protein [Solimonas marina]|uniref:Nuclear transport factor 2 family protein n=1 Tax=Solimonas marina TaxID=2714601 RepID=A0A970B854_9GAMM|nr:DUF4440 domain-containing protein [Solimonas marina]NKF21924.1 nuclear transport factor 2 family protein [Solimonas marina]
MSTLIEVLRALETELHHPGTRCSRGRLEQLLHPDFHEVGRSGQAYDRETVIRFLAQEQAPANVVSDDFAVAAIAPGVALLTYRSARRDAQHGLTLHALRSSLWIMVDGHWQLRYHQGTPAAQSW